MGNISYPKSWTAGEVLTAADLNGNFNAVTAVVNSNLTNSNINASADIAPTKIGDASATATDYGSATADPSNTSSLPTTLTGELQALRGQLDLVVGATNWYDTPPASLTTLNTSDGQIPTHGANLVGRNSGFDEEFAGSTATPAGWTAKGGATFATAATTNTQGSGQMLTITDGNNGSNADGLTRTITGLKAGQVYGFSADIKSTDTDDSGRVRVETMSGTDLALTFDGNVDTTAWVKKSGTFTTGAADSEIDIVIDLDTALDVVTVDNVSIVELGSTKAARPAGQALRSVATAAHTLAFTGSSNWTDWPADAVPTTLEQGVVVHSPGYYIKATATLVYQVSGGSTQNVAFRIVNDIDGGGDVSLRELHERPTNQNDIFVVTVVAIVQNPTVGSEYLFTPQIVAGAQVIANPQRTVGAETVGGLSDIIVELLPY